MKRIFKSGLMAAVAAGAFAAATAFAAEEVAEKTAAKSGAEQPQCKAMHGGKGPAMGGRGQNMMAMMAKELNLTDDQKAKIKEIMDTQKGKVGEAMKNREGLQKKYMEAVDAGDAAAAKAAVDAIAKEMADNAVTRIEIKKQIDAILTPEQKVKGEELRKAHQAKMEQMREKMRERMQERMSGKSGNSGAEGEGCCPPPPDGAQPPPPPAE